MNSEENTKRKVNQMVKRIDKTHQTSGQLSYS